MRNCVRFQCGSRSNRTAELGSIAALPLLEKIGAKAAGPVSRFRQSTSHDCQWVVFCRTLNRRPGLALPGLRRGGQVRGDGKGEWPLRGRFPNGSFFPAIAASRHPTARRALTRLIHRRVCLGFGDAHRNDRACALRIPEAASAAGAWNG